MKESSTYYQDRSMSNRNFVWLLLAFTGLLILLGACTPANLSKEELIQYVQKPSNGLHKKQDANGINVSVHYRPTDLLVDQELGEKRDADEIQRLKDKYGEYAYFILNLDVEGKEALYKASQDQMSFSQNLQTLSFRMSEYVNLTTSTQDTIPVADYVFNRTFGLGSGSSLMFVFNKEKMKDSDWISFNLNEFGMNTGDQRFRFQMKDLQAIPKLKELNISDI